MDVASRVGIVTGANRGIGREVARQLAVRGLTIVLAARDPEKAEEAARGLGHTGVHVLPRQLDVDDPSSVERLVRQVAEEHGRLDVLVNNAAIHYDTWQRAEDADLRVVRAALETNLLGAWSMCKACIPLMRSGRDGRIVNVSSGAGSLAEMSGGHPAYGVSKAALNALTRKLAAELRGSGILVNAVCPGWVATDMGGPGGRPVGAGAAGIVWAAELPHDGPTGGFFRNGRELAW